MRHAKIKKTGDMKFFFMILISSLTLATLISCDGRQDVKKREQPLNKRQAAASLNAATDKEKAKPKENIKTKVVKWNCVSCGYVNTNINNICTNCDKNKQIHSSNSQSPKTGIKAGVKQNNSSDTNSDSLEDEACPVCLDDGALTTNGSHICKQCKKSICNQCHKQMKNMNKYFCPLCRYEPKRQPRKRSRTL